MTFSRFVTVLGADDRVCDTISRSTAVIQYAKGLLMPLEVRDGLVVWARRTDILVHNTAKPGSFGIDRFALGNGYIVFQHKNTYAAALGGSV